MTNQILALLILLFPASGALLLAGRGWRLPRIFTVIVGPGVVWASFVCVLALFSGKASGDFTYWTWIKSGAFEVPFTLLIDNLSISMCLVITVIGDVGMILGTFVLFTQYHAVTYAKVFDALPCAGGRSCNGGGDPTLELAGFLLLVGAVAKSAQLPLHTWLPDAMEGPTPVSALIHAATMVTAGVYLVGRMHPIYDVATYAHSAVAIVGAVTALFAATIAIVQVDIKRVLA